MNKRGISVFGVVFFSGILFLLIVFVVAPINKANAQLSVNELGINGMEGFLVSSLNIFFLALLFIFMLAVLSGTGAFNK